MNKLNKLSVTLFSLLLGGCAGTKVVGSIECGDAQIDIMSIKNERNTLNGQTWSYGIAYDGVTLKVHDIPYPGYLPASYARQTTGTKAVNDVRMHDFPHGTAFQFFLGEFPAKDRQMLTQCLVENDKTLRSLFLKTKGMQQFPPSGAFDSKFVFWDAKETDLNLRFDAQGSQEEYLSLSLTNSIYYNNKSKKQFLKVGELEWDKEAKLINVGISIVERRKIVPNQTDPKAFKRDGKTLAEYFSVPFVDWAEKY